MDSTLVMIAALAAACSFVFGVLLHMLIVFIMGKRAKHTDAESTIAKWLESRERTVRDLAQLRADVQRLSNEIKNAKQGDTKDTQRIWERIKQLEADMDWAAGQIEDHTALIAELQPAKPANSTNGRYVR